MKEVLRPMVGSCLLKVGLVVRRVEKPVDVASSRQASFPAVERLPSVVRRFQRGDMAHDQGAQVRVEGLVPFLSG